MNLKLENNTCADFSDWCFFGIDQPKTLEEQQAQGADSKHFKRSKIFLEILRLNNIYLNYYFKRH